MLEIIYYTIGIISGLKFLISTFKIEIINWAYNRARAQGYEYTDTRLDSSFDPNTLKGRFEFLINIKK